MNKKIYHIAFSCWQPMPGIITLAADNEEAAINLLNSMTSELKDVKVIEIVDISNMESVQQAAENMARAVDMELHGYPDDDEPQIMPIPTMYDKEEKPN